MPNEIQVVVKSQDRTKLDSISADAKKTGKEIGTGIERGFKDAEQAGDKATSGIKKSLGKLGNAGKEAGKGMTEGITGSLGELGKVAGIAAAGALIGEQLMQGLERQFEEQKVGGMIAAQTGQASEAAGQLGETAGAVFYDNFGESIEQVGEAMTAAFQNRIIDTSSSQAEVQTLTEKIITLSQVSGEEFNAVARSSQQLVRTGLADSITEAMDMIDHAVDKGLNTSGELLDTVDEYSTLFRGLGISGQEAFGLISQAVDGGARNVDVAADALKEFQIRAQDMSTSTARGFKTIGLDGQRMGDMIAAGGKPAHEALRMTLNALQNMPPSVERSQAAVDLFGTKAEDLGTALYDMDLDEASEQFGDFAGSVDDDMQTISDSTPIIERWGRNFGKALDQIGDGFQAAKGAFDSFMDGLTGVEGGNDAAMAAINGTADATDEETDAQKANAEQHKETSSEIQTHVQSLEELIAAQLEAAGKVLDERDAMRDYRKSVKDATDAVDNHKQVSDEEAEKLDNVAKSALDAADSMVKNGRSTDEVNKVVNTARARFIQLAQRMGYSKQEAINLANSLRLIPRKVDASVVVHTEAARANVAAFQRALNNLHDKTITVSTYVRGANITGSGGHIFVQQSGGISTAASGGARSSATLINEAGPEVVQLPNGSKVMTAGATRAMAERGLLAVDGILETAATGGVRGRGLPAYRKTGQVGVAGHSKQFIDNLLAQGWRYMDSSKGTLYSPERQDRAGANRVFTTDAGRINIAEGRHSAQYIQNLVNQGWRTMDGNMNELIAPWLQRKAGKGRRFSVGDLTETGGRGGGRLESHAEATPLTGRHGTPDVNMHITGDADTAVGAMINRLHRDGHIRFSVRS
jgi:hypothetical protein